MLFKKKTFSRARKFSNTTIPVKANKILNLVLLVMVFIVLRCWHLSVIQYEDRLESSKKPKIRALIERAERGSIRDRFNIPLAANKVQYNASILYAHIRDIPFVMWKKGEDGKRVKKYVRRNYIADLSRLIADELNLSANWVEDTIHSRAALFPNTPFPIKEDISEKEYFRLKMLEKDWLGLHGERVPKRYYPLGRVGSDIIGYMGAISREEYLSIANEINMLERSLSDWEEGEGLFLPEGFSNFQEVRHRLEDLKQRVYTINDYVGKTGIEGQFDESLRGFCGKQVFYTDARGNFLRELPGFRRPLSGQRVLLSISAELQEFAEQLLIQNEEIRDGRSTTFDRSRQTSLSLKQPWIKGGAIVAIDPNNGEVLAMASYPRFDPNDFILSGDKSKKRRKISNIRRWFESESYIADIWDGKLFMERERFNDRNKQSFEEKRELTWERYLDFILPKENHSRKALREIGNIRNAVMLQRAVKSLLRLSGQDDLYNVFNILYSKEGHLAWRDRLSSVDRWKIEGRFQEEKEEMERCKKLLDRFFSSVRSSYDKVLAIDLCRLIVEEEMFTDRFLDRVGEQSFSEYRSACASMAVVNDVVYSMARRLFRELHFRFWREENQKEYLKEKREEERVLKRYARPYLDYLEKKEKALFEEFWETYRFGFLMTFLSGKLPDKAFITDDLESYFSYFQAWEKELSQGAHALVPWRGFYERLRKNVGDLSEGDLLTHLQMMRSYRELVHPLYGYYRNIRSDNGKQVGKHLAGGFYPKYGYGYGRSQAYRQSAIQGSIFKITVAYEALRQRYHSLREQGENLYSLNPFEMIDNVQKTGGKRGSWIVGYKLNGEAIPQFYNGGRLPRSDKRNIGRIDLVKAIEASSNPYFSLLAGDFLEDPEDLNKAASDFSYGDVTGIDLKGEISGSLPSDISSNRTGLYAYAIGQHSLVVTPLQTSLMMSSIANGGKVFKPKIVNITVGTEPAHSDEKVFSRKLFSFQSSLALAGIDFPFFTAAEEQVQERNLNIVPSEVRREIFLPSEIRNILLEGMYQVVNGNRGSARSNIIHNYYDYPHMLQDYTEMRRQMVGKTSTSETVEAIDLDKDTGTNLYKHIWFAGISFDPKEQGENWQEGDLSKRFVKPELVVVVYLRFGDYGREAAPLVAQMIKKWRKIKEKNS